MTWHVDGVGGEGRRIAVIVTLALVALVPIFFITCSATEPPILTLLPKLDNAAVYPEESETWTQTLNYTVNCNFSMPASITLEIYNLSLHDWTTVGDETYTDAGEWQTLTWNNVKICGGKCEGTSSYRFKYNETILLTESGPIIAPPPPAPPAPKMFRNATVKPASGDYNDSFDYSVWVVKLNKTTNITLEVYDISSYEWRPMGEEGYSKKGEWQLLTWADVTNVSAKDSAGVASYRFFFVEAGGERHESDVFYGPYLELYPTPTPTVIYRGGGGGGGGISSLLRDEELQKELAEKLSPFITPVEEEIRTPQIVDTGVTPKRGSWHQSFNYWVEVEHPNRADMWLTLEVYCPGKGENYTISSQGVWMYDDANRAKVEWRGVNVFNKEDVRANESPRYYIHYNDGCNKDSWGLFSGPELYFPPVLTDPSVSPDEGTYKEQFVYNVDVMDEEGADVNVTLYIVDSERSEIYNETHVINGTEAKGGKTESWIYSGFTEAAADTAFSYYFCATDGIASNTTGVHVGPYIKHSEFSLLWIILAIIAGLAVVSGVLWLAYTKYFRREVEEVIK